LSHHWNSFTKYEQICCCCLFLHYKKKKNEKQSRVDSSFLLFDERGFFERDGCDFWQVSVYSGNQSCPARVPLRFLFFF
jgi:hypothetical protein